MSYTDIQFINTVAVSKSKAEVGRRLGLKKSGYTNNLVTREINRLGLDTSHFVLRKAYPRIDKECPVCGNVFFAQSGSPKEKQTCSHACANTFFRSGENNANYKGGYRHICLRHHEAECIICGWDVCIHAHHIDGDHTNNDPKNLVPLCPNHHAMAHMVGHSEQIKSQIQAALV